MLSSNSHIRVSLRLIVCFLIVIAGSEIPLSAQSTKQPEKRSLSQPLRIPPGKLTLRLILDLVPVQCGYSTYAYGDIPTDRPIHPLGKTPADSTLGGILEKLDLYFVLQDSTVIIKRKKDKTRQIPTNTASVKVEDADHKNLSGAKITLANSRTSMISDTNGMAHFRINGQQEKATVSARHRHTEEIELEKDKLKTVILSLEFDPMREVILTGYENTIKMDYTGDRFVVTGAQAYCTPGTNLLASLTGRVPGLSIIQSSGVPGSSYSATVRGHTSVLNGRDPLFIVDGVPFSAGNQSLSYIRSGSAAGSLSPWSFLALTDVEKIEILKDAAATSIYGSRGANGVILITTKRGKQQKPHISFEFSTGSNSITRRPTLLTTGQYTQMRLEALRNDSLKPNNSNAPDLTVWDTTHSTDWGRWLIGDMTSTTQAKASVSGGTRNTQYFGSVNGLEEKNVFPFHPTHDLLSIQGSFDHHSKDQKLTLRLSTLLDLDRNNQVTTDPTQWQFLTPNAPPLTQHGQIVFSARGISFDNPLSFLLEPYKATSYNILDDATIDYRLWRHLTISTNVGYSGIGVHEFSSTPISSLPPTANTTGSSQFEFTHYSSNIIEPTLVYKKDSGNLLFTALGGATWQDQNSNTRYLADQNIPNDALLTQSSLAYNKPGAVQKNAYYYKALFAKTTLNWDHTYILDLSGRRDGSSRFGPGFRYGLFWAAGAAWVFWKDNWREKVPFIGMGKLRASYGITGNDQIATNNSWTPNAVISFQGIPSYNAIVKPGQTWETISKTEISTDWSLFDNRLLFTASWYRNRAGNQLLPDTFPLVGTNAVFSNNKHVISQTSGYEFSLTSINIEKPHFKWTTNLNLSLPSDKLIAFPGLAQSNYAASLAIGRSLEVVNAYRYLGVDPYTGIFRFQGKDSTTGFILSPQTAVGKLAVTCQGGIDNTFRIGPIQAECLIEGRAQTGSNYLNYIYSTNPPGVNNGGMYTNVTTDLLDHWRGPGNRVPYQKLTSGSNGALMQAASLYAASSAPLTSASFIRIKDICLTYYWPPATLQKMHLSSVGLFVRAQNLATFTPYRGVDPEIQSATTMPPMRTVVTGIRLEY